MTATIRSAALAATMLTLLAGCAAPTQEPSVAFQPAGLVTGNGIAQNGIAQNGIAQNGIAQNGIAQNGIAQNGIAQNGIAQNGIAQNGMLTSGLAPGDGSSGLAANGLVESSFATPEFQTWFARDPSYSDMVMSYLLRCALPATATLTYTTDTSAHSWTGNLGLAPSWASGQPIPVVEQELVSACLTAHVNRYGRHVSISVRGVNADGSMLETTEDERTAYTFGEGCFFGNLFDGTGTWSGVEDDSLDPATTTPRGCVAAFGVETACVPMAPAGRCADACTRHPGEDAYDACTATLVDGTVRSFRPVNVKLQPATVFRCGDGTCQFTESAESCPADCAQP